MNGILSARPGQGAIRLVVAADGLLLIQSVLLLLGDDLLGAFRLPVLGVTLIAALASVAAVIGDGSDHDRPWRLPR